jgi:glycosyltransferase involved in cell wall biosynthesis
LTRVLFLAESFHPVLGGGETHLRRLGSGLVRAGDAATVVTRRGDSVWPPAEDVDGIRVVRVPPAGPGRTGKYRMIPAAIRAVLREARGHDLLVVRSLRVLGLPALVAGRLAGLPVVLQPETNGELDGTAFTFGKPWAAGAAGRLVRLASSARNALLRDADAFVAMSRAIRDEMILSGVPPERAFLLPHGVDVGRYRPAATEEKAALRRSLGLPAGLLAVYTGRLLRGKGLDTLLEAFAPMAAARPDVQLVLVGGGDGQSLSVEPELRARAGTDPLAGRVLFAGRVEDVSGWLRAADVFVFPSVFEGLGISLVEALACGLPAIGSRTGGIVDVIDEERSGLLVPPGDPVALGSALGRLLDDVGAREAMGRAGRTDMLARFDERDALARYRALFASLVRSGRPTPPFREGRPAPASPADAPRPAQG